MTHEHRTTHRNGAWLASSCISALLIGVLLYEIVSEPDEGGIWDGYVPTWLGGEGPNGGRA